MQAKLYREFTKFFAGLWLTAPSACIEEYDSLVQGYFHAPSQEHKKFVVGKARKRADAETDEKKKSRALYYAKMLEQLLAKGDKFLDSEIDRVDKLLQSKVSDEKKEQLKDRANILTSFRLRQKDEL